MHCTGHQSHEVTTPTVALRKLHCTLAETSITLYCENSIALRDSLKRSQRPLMVLDHLWSLKGLTKRAQQFQAQDNAPSTLPWGSFCPLPTPPPPLPLPLASVVGFSCSWAQSPQHAGAGERPRAQSGSTQRTLGKETRDSGWVCCRRIFPLRFQVSKALGIKSRSRKKRTK